MPWWGWVILGAVLLGSELMIVDAAFYLVFVGLAAVIVGLLGLAGVAMEPWAQWLLFAGLNIVLMVFFRKRLYNQLRGNTPDYAEGPVGEHIQIESRLEPGASTRVQFRGTNWTVLNGGEAPLEAGARVKVDKVDGLTVIVNLDQ